MFGFGKKKKKQHELEAASQKQEEEQKKQKGRIEKLIMGAIVGAAVGSVIGMTIAPKKGKETRKMISEIGKKIIDETRAPYKQLKKEIEGKSGFFSKLKEKLLHSRAQKETDKYAKESQKKADPKETEQLEDIFKRIPHERP